MNKNEHDPQFLVGVRCMTYNQHAFIEDAMNGFCKQETKFPFIAVIVDDASNDGEPEVIINYIYKHFDFSPQAGACQWENKEARFLFARHCQNSNCYFGVVLLKTNYYSKKKDKEPLIAQWLCSVKYYALCEGDDYWTDPQKLQIQVDFMENHSDYSMCFHRAAVLDYIGYGSGLRCFEIEDRDYSSDELFSQWIVPTNSMLYKHECSNYPIIQPEKILNHDIFWVLSCSHTGKVRGMSKYMSVYRIHKGGVTYDPMRKKERTMRYPEHYECIRDNFPKISKQIINKSLGLHYYNRSLIQTNETLRKKDYCMAKFYIPEQLEQYKLNKYKQIIKKIIFFPYHLLRG